MISSRKIIEKLEAAGWVFERQGKGDHVIYIHPDHDFPIVIVHPRKDCPIGLVRKYERQSGVKLR
ncbi:type II toxin-antitoxin system HicA family toxin [Thalassospira sp.]|uniref:type II toxin-antitoxin system HicA family toxin n=1 Tax=Thalassospira sp. TaxID=1912094 RepID=UPI00345A0BDE